MSDYIVNPIKKVSEFTFRKKLVIFRGHQLKKTPCINIAICIDNLTASFYLRVDVKELHNQFKMFPADAVIGVARDLDKR